MFSSGLFHSEDGLYFQREPDGSVTIIKTSDGKEPRENGGNIDFLQILPPGVWCSAVCSVSASGEEQGRWCDAMAFHNEVTTVPAPSSQTSDSAHSGIHPDDLHG